MIPVMGTIASQEYPESDTPSEEGGARAAILGAARRVAAREGVVEMTLTSVAKEASVSAGNVYAFFTSKNDLLQAVVADDLAHLAKTMRRSLDSRTGSETVPVPPANGSATESEHAPELTASAPGQETARRFPAVQPRREEVRPGLTEAPTPEANAATAEAIARLQEQVTKLEARPIDHWLERRLREFERALEALQTHPREKTASDNSFEQDFQVLHDAIAALDTNHATAIRQTAQALGGRMDELERRLRQVLSDVEAQSVHMARRIAALENLAFSSRPEMVPAPVELPPVVEAAPEPATELPASSETTDDAATENAERMPSYLAAARRSAQAAAAQASDEHAPKPTARKPKKLLVFAALGSLAVFAILLGGLGFLLRNASMNPPPVAVAAKSAPMHVAHTVPAKPRPRVAQKSAGANLIRLAEMGDPSAELLVGLEYLEGKGVPKNEGAAVDWLSRAAAKGQPVAQYDLGALYADGRGVRADSVQAFQWFGAAALHGNRRAMHFLAIAYAEGIGTAKNLFEAARWFERSANLGAVNSQFNLAVLYERGMGVQQSLPTAYKWYAIAAAQGDHEAQARVTALASTLNTADLASAKGAAESFKPQPLDPAANLPPKLPT